MKTIKIYRGRIPACGVFCGGCPMYIRETKPCPGAEMNRIRCENCKSFHLCCKEKGISHCYQCKAFPCTRFKRFSRNWEKYGQDFIENQKILQELGADNFLEYFNSKRLFVRKILPEEYPLMEKIMYEAIYHPDPANPYSKKVIYYPQVRVYWDNWGKEKDDHCLVGVVNNKIAGAVWIRTFQHEIKGCGYIDDQTPEIAIALFDGYRNQGFGTEMMKHMIALMKGEGFRQVSLSITKGNRAIRLYERLGFKTVDENEEDYIMLMPLA